MDHGGEAARPTTAGSTELSMAGAVQGSEANIGSGSFSDFDLSGEHHSSTGFARHVRAVARRGEAPVAAGFHLQRQPGQGVAYPNFGEFRRQPGPVHVVLAGPRLPDGAVVPVHENYGYSALQPRPGAGRGEVLVNLLPEDPGHGEAFVGQLPGGGGTAYGDYGYYALQPHPVAGHGQVLVDLLLESAGHGDVFVGLLPGGGVAVHDDYGYYPWQPRPGAVRGEVFIGPLPDGGGAVFDNSSNFAQQTVPATGRADGIAGALRGRNLAAGYDGSGALAGAAYNNLRRLLPFAGIGACSVAVNGLAAGPVSPAVAFHLFAMFLGGLLLVILHVLRM